MKFLAEFTSSPSLEQFRSSEFVAAAEIEKCEIQLVALPSWWSNDMNGYFLLFECESITSVKRIARRCVLLRAIYIILLCAPTLISLHEYYEGKGDCRSIVCGKDKNEYWIGDYNYRVETIGKKYTGSEKKELIQRLEEKLPHKGQVSWSKPDKEFIIIIYHSDINEEEKCVFFGILCCESARRELLSKYDLKKRPYIGTTSMPPEESFLMANFCRVQTGCLVYDPFCGTGSLLVAASHFGAHTLGSDSDGRAMRSGSIKFRESPQMKQQQEIAIQSYTEEDLENKLSKEERMTPSMITNFKLYGLRLPDRLRFNFSMWAKGFSSLNVGLLDCILTDPPYGLREPRKKIEDGDTSSLTLSSYNTMDVVIDLILFAAQHLRVGGYLGFWHPTSDNYTDEELPRHPSLEVISNTPQRLSLKVVRRLIIMKKFKSLPDPPPDRSSCLPQKQADNLRELLGKTSMPENQDYMEYRRRIEKRREATNKYLSSVNPSSADTTTKSKGNRRGRKNQRCFTQEEIVANRKRNIRLREERQLLSHIENEERRRKNPEID